MRAAWAVLTLGMLGGCHGARVDGRLPRIDSRTPYVQARRTLLQTGFKPAQFGPTDEVRRRLPICDDWRGQRCRTFGETYDCRLGQCEFDFVRVADHRVLAVLTHGGETPAVTALYWASPADVAARRIVNR